MGLGNCLESKFSFSLISILVLILFLLSSVYSAAPVLTDDELLDSTQAKAANYFYEQVLSNGFVKDTSAKSFSSIAATGFGLAAFTVMSERYGSNSNWTYTPYQLRVRTNQILDHIIYIQNNQSSNPSKYGVKGLLFHWMDASDNPVNGDGVSTVDNALLFAGVITAGEYFGGEVKTKADAIVAKADWNYFLKTPENDFTSNQGSQNMYQFSMGWNQNLFSQTWNRPTDEAILISLLAIASKLDNNDFQKSLFSWPRVVRSYGGYNVVNSYTGSLFTYLFAHIFVDFNLIGKDAPLKAGVTISAVDWWQNSINAAKANRQFCIDNSGAYSSYGEDSWGLSAVEKPNKSYFGGMSALPNDNQVANHDGTMSPYGGISTIALFKGEDDGVLMNNLGFRVLRNLYNTRYNSLWGTYGPKDSFNQYDQYSSITSGIDQGPIVLMIENYRTGLVQNQFMKNASIKTAISKVFSCPEGICDSTIPVCTVNSDCGVNGYVESNFCSADSLTVQKVYRTFECLNPGTNEAVCKVTDENKVQVNCLSNQTCSDGACITDCSDKKCDSCIIPKHDSVLDTSVTFCKLNNYYPNNVTVSENDITIDCNGAAIGFSKLLNRDNVTFKNCVFLGTNYSLQIEQSSNIKLIDSNNTGSWDWGFYVQDSNNILISNTLVKSCSYRAGIAFINTHNSIIENSLITNNGGDPQAWGYAGGLYFSDSNNNRVVNNSIVKNRRALTISDSSNNYFENNSFCLNKFVNSCSGSLNIASVNKLPINATGLCSWLNSGGVACDQSCVDSDENLLPKDSWWYGSFFKGNVTFWDGNSTQIYSDSCYPDSNYLNEYSCNYGIMQQNFMICEDGCVNDACVYVRCKDDSYCNDNNYQTTDTCVNPSTPQSTCQYTKSDIACSTNAQCGTNELVGKVCNGNYLYDVMRIFTCNNAGTFSSYCSSIDTNSFNQTCNYGCLSGTCVGAPITCSTNTECNDNDSSTVDICVNPGTASSQCSHTPVQIICSSNAQCNDNNPNTTDTCLNPGTAQSYCTNIKPAIVCSSTTQCGVNGWLGQITCNGKNIGDYYRTYKCVNPGKITSYCKVTDKLKTKSSCSNGKVCAEGTCVTPACKSSSACNDSNKYTKDVCVNPGKLTSVCTYTPIACLSKTDCDDGDGFTLDVCKNPKKTTSYCTHTPIACTDDLSCNDNNPYTLDKCSRPNTTSSKCTYTSVKCSTNADCDDFNPQTSNVCMNAGTKKSYCEYYPKIPDTIWSLSPNSDGVVFNSATCDVSKQKVCPQEMGWEGRKITYKFVLPQGELTDTLALKFNVSYMNYGGTNNVLLKISAGSSTSSLKTINSSLEIDQLGEYTVLIPKSYFKQGAKNYIQLYGTNITPTGYGTNPPNFQTNLISLNQVK